MPLYACLRRARPAELLKQSGTGSPRLYATDVRYFANEPTRPVIVTNIPGPAAKRTLSEIDKVFDTNNVNMVTDFDKSVGNL